MPGLCVVVQLHDAVGRGDYARASEHRMWADNYGITPKGRQDRRWLPPVVEPPETSDADHHAHLRPVR